MQPTELIDKAKVILADRWSTDNGYGRYGGGPVCLIGGLVEAGRTRMLSEEPYNTPSTVDTENAPAFEEAVRAVYSCVQFDLDTNTGGPLEDVEDWNDEQTSVETILTALDCARSKVLA